MAMYELPRKEAPGFAGMGERIYRLRKRNDLTIPQLAELLNVGKSSISKWERSSHDMNAEHVMPICDLFGVPPLWLLTGTGPDHL